MTNRTRHLAPDRLPGQPNGGPGTPSTTRARTASEPRSEPRSEPGTVRPGDGRFDPRAWRHAVKEDAPEIEASAPKAKLSANPPLRTQPHDRQPQKMQPQLDPSHLAAMASARSPAMNRLEAVPSYVPAASHQAAAQDGGTRWRYLAVWAVVGSVSAAYVAGMAWQRSANFELAIAPITESLERLAGDIADLKQVTSAIDARERLTADRVANTESRLSRFADIASPAAQATILAVPQAVTAHGQRPTNRAVLSEETTSIAAPAVIEPPRSKQAFPGIVLAQPGTPTGLVVGPAPAKIDPRTDGRAAGLPKSTPAAGAVNAVKTGTLSEPSPAGRKQSGLLIASGPSLDAIRLSWNVLTQNHGSALGPVEPRVLPAGDGSVFQLIAGPYASDADAAKACANLRSRGVTCRMTEFTGAAL